MFNAPLRSSAILCRAPNRPVGKLKQLTTVLRIEVCSKRSCRRVCGSVYAETTIAGTRTEAVELETDAARLSSHYHFVVRVDRHLTVVGSWRGHVIVAASVLVEDDYQKRAFPIRALAKCVVNRREQRLAPMQIRRTVELVGIALRVHVVFGPPNHGIEIDRFDERVVRKPV